MTARSWPSRIAPREHGPTSSRSPNRVARDRRVPRASTLAGREATDPLAVHPVELLVVEGGGRVRHAVEVERADDLVDVHHLPAVLGCPPEQREVVAQRLGEVARGRGSPRARPRRDASRAWPGRVRGSAGGARTRGGPARRAPRAGRARGASSRCRSSPRITWVIPISRSSTALARKKIGLPSERTITKSEIVSHSTRTSPRTTSTKWLAPSSGVRNRIERGRPSAARPSPLAGRQVAAVAVVAGRTARGSLAAAPCASAPRRCSSTRRPVRSASSCVGGGAVLLRSARSGGTGPSSQSRPSQRSVSWIPTTHSLARPGPVGVLDAEDERARRGGGRRAS